MPSPIAAPPSPSPRPPQGSECFQGVQLHAKDFQDVALARNRRVVIVGAGKSAMDCVASCASANIATSVTLLYRQAHWCGAGGWGTGRRCRGAPGGWRRG